MALRPNLAAFIDNRNTIHVFPRSTYWIRTTLRQGKEVPAAFEVPGHQTLTVLASGNETEEVDCFPLKAQAICQHIKRLDELVLTLPVTDFTSSRRHSIVRDAFSPALEHVGKLRIQAITSADPLDMMCSMGQSFRRLQDVNPVGLIRFCSISGTISHGFFSLRPGSTLSPSSWVLIAPLFNYKSMNAKPRCC
jgi:hypothetical protein